MENNSGAVAVLFNAANRRRAAGDALGASVLLDELLSLAPDHAGALNLLATLHLAGNPHAAARLASRLVQLTPESVSAWTLLGQAVSALSRGDEALRAFTRAVELGPDDAGAANNLAVAQLRAGDPFAALEAAGRAIKLNASLPEAHASLGHAYNVLHKSNEAVAAFETALRLRPAFPDALLGMANAQKDLGRPSSAVVALLRATEISAGAMDYRMSLASAYHDIGDIDAARDIRRKAEELAPSLTFASTALMCEQYDPDIDDRAAAESARRWGLRQIAAVPATPRKAKKSVGGKIRIGYVSADLYRHPVGWLGGGAICAHDRNAFDVTIYANQTCADDLTAQIRQSVDAWIPVQGLDDDQAAARIAADEIDILVDLSGHTAGNRLGVFARRPAPVQLAWLGYFATTGLPTIDCVLMDDAHFVPGAEALFVEKVIRLKECRFCYQPPHDAETPAPPPSLGTGRVTFGSFNNAAKINRRVLALWAQTLAAVENSDLLLKWRSFADPLLQARVRADFERNGVDPGRIKFDGATPHPEMLKQYGRVDIALDPFPFSGGLTSCEALWMGVPVITLPGARPVSRQTHSILRAIRRSEFSAPSPAAYVAMAGRLARDGERLAALRKNLRGEMARSPLCDAKNFTARLEAIYRDLIG